VRSCDDKACSETQMSLKEHLSLNAEMKKFLDKWAKRETAKREKQRSGSREWLKKIWAKIVR
jgi:hypothetical protein